MSESQDQPFKVDTFSIENFAADLSNPYCLEADIKQLRNINIIFGYLHDIQIKTIVVESQYIDGDYLDDVSNYYVKCFKQYDRFCKRLHFFCTELTREQVESIVLGEADESLVKKFIDAYQGFIVARPLPIAVIGRTLLATYPDDNNRRNYLCINDNRVHFFGLELNVKSLEYQEQDSILAACATVALWTSLHKTHHMFQTPIRPPATITRQANEVVHSSRPIPSHGLIVQQINNAILRNDLVAEIIDVSDETPLMPLIYGYVQAGLPVILGVEIEGIGLHAITVLGYSLDPKATHPNITRSNEIPFRANKIDELYAHDDQIVPFSRIVKHRQGRQEQVYFDGSWIDETNGQNRKMTPRVVIIPIYHKVRVGFSDVYKWFTCLNLIRPFCKDMMNITDHLALNGLQELIDQNVFSSLAEILNPNIVEWDLFLTNITDFKKDIRNDLPTQAQNLRDILLMSHPRFIWRALLKDKNGKILLELLSDATDIPRMLPFYAIIWRDKDLQRWLYQLIDHTLTRTLLERFLTRAFVEFLRTH